MIYFRQERANTDTILTNKSEFKRSVKGMTAITIADRSTQIRGDDALGPNSSEASVELSQDQLKERKLYDKYPELEPHVNAEWAVLQRWVAFKIAPSFVEQIYKGTPLEMDRDVAINDHIIPELKDSRLQYLSESAHIVGKHIPSLKKRIAEYSDEASRLEDSVISTLDKIDSGDTSPKLKLDASSWYRQAHQKRKLVSDLQEDVPKAVLNAHVKDATFYRINDFVTRLARGEQTDKADDIIHASKKIALEQVINSLKSDRALADKTDDDEETIIRGYDRQIELLEVELRALEDIITTETIPVEVESEVNEEQTSLLKNFQRRLLGSFSSRAAALYGAFIK